LNDALHVFQEASIAWPNEPRFPLFAAQAYLDLDRVREAFTEFNAATRMDPSDAAAYLGLAYCHVLLRIDLPRAISLAETGLKYAQDSKTKALLNSVLAEAYYATNDLKNCKTSYNRALKMMPDSVLAQQCKARVEFDEIVVSKKNTQKSNTLGSPELLIHYVLGEWDGLLEISGRTFDATMKLELGETPTTITGEINYTRRSDGLREIVQVAGIVDPQSLKLRLSGSMKTETDTIYSVADIYAALPPNQQGILWTCPGGSIQFRRR
jgi:tetratricopeptide (TPR) repeat protein